MKTINDKELTLKIRWTVVLFILLLVLSGITAFPLQTELNFLIELLEADSSSSGIDAWIYNVTLAINDVNTHYPFLSYGTDWLAFAHIIIALFFIGVYKDPIRNNWITTVGIIACLLVFPLAFIAGAIRNIPLFWQLIDCSFGAIGLIPLLYIHQQTKNLIINQNTSS